MTPIRPPSLPTAAWQKQFYDEQGYLLGLPPIFTKEEMARISGELPNLLALLKPGRDDQRDAGVAS